MGEKNSSEMVLQLRLLCVWMVIALCCASDTSVPESDPAASDQGTQLTMEDAPVATADVEEDWQKMPVDKTSRRGDDSTEDEDAWIGAEADAEEALMAAEDEQAQVAAEEEADRVAAAEQAADDAAEQQAAENARIAEEEADEFAATEEERQRQADEEAANEHE